MHSKHFKIEQLRARNAQKVQEALLVLILALFVTAMLPSILVQFVFTSANPFEQPAVLQYIPVASFAVAIIYLAMVMIGNWSREKKAVALENELVMNDCGCEGCDCGDSQLPPVTEAELKELEGIVEQALQEDAASSRKTTSRATSKVSPTKSASKTKKVSKKSTKK